MGDTTNVTSIAATLGESDEGPLRMLKRAVEVIGKERALTLLEETLRIEREEGGQRVNDGSRSRTRGGIFFRLLKDRTSRRERARIFRRELSEGSNQPKKVISIITWEECTPLFAQVLDLPAGEISTVKITLIGRPDRTIEKPEFVLLHMKSEKVPNLPKGLPVPPSKPTDYIVCLSKKHWRKVAESLTANPDDKLIVEGFPYLNENIGAKGVITVMGTQATTLLLQRAQREVRTKE